MVKELTELSTDQLETGSITDVQGLIHQTLQCAWLWSDLCIREAALLILNKLIYYISISLRDPPNEINKDIYISIYLLIYTNIFNIGAVIYRIYLNSLETEHGTSNVHLNLLMVIDTQQNARIAAI